VGDQKFKFASKYVKIREGQISIPNFVFLEENFQTVRQFFDWLKFTLPFCRDANDSAYN